MANPLTDELTADAKAELAAIFAELRLRYEASRPKRLRSQLIRVAAVRTGW